MASAPTEIDRLRSEVGGLRRLVNGIKLRFLNALGQVLLVTLEANPKILEVFGSLVVHSGVFLNNQIHIRTILQHLNLFETDDPDFPDKVLIYDINGGVGRIMWLDDTGGSPVFKTVALLHQNGDIETGPLLLMKQDDVHEGGAVQFKPAGSNTAEMWMDRFDDYWRVHINSNESLRVGQHDVRVVFGGTETFFSSLAETRLNGQAVTFGANDSAGSGFRTVRVPNV